MTRLSCRLLALGLVATTSCSTAPPEMDPPPTPTVVPIETGGALEFPAGALSDTATVTVGAVTAPRLPLGVEALGDAIQIEVDQAATRPLQIRMPVPVGQSTDQLGIYQVRGNGATRLLSTTVDAGFLVATTDHFTIKPVDGGSARAAQSFPELDALRAAIGLRTEQDEVPEISPPRQGTIVGPGFLAPGQVALYSLAGFDAFSGAALQIEWNLYATGGSLAVPSDQPAAGAGSVVLFASRSARVVVDDNASGSFDLTCSYVDPASGTSGFVATTVSIQDPDVVGDLVLTYLEGQTERVAGVEGGGFLVGVSNLTGTTVAFDWDYGTGNIGDTGGQGNIGLTVRTPSVTYTDPGEYVLTVTATAQDQSTGELAIPITVRSNQVEVVIEGPAVIDPIVSPFDSDTYTVVITNGTPPFTLTSQLFPGSGSTMPTVSDERQRPIVLGLADAGSYVLSATVTDDQGGTASYVRPLTVSGDGPPVLTFGAEFDTAPVETLVNFAYEVTGGVLVVNGTRSDGYTLHIDWGDGDSATVDVPSGGTRSTVSGALPHRYNDAGTYTAEARVVDASGEAAVRQAVITIEEEPLDCPVPCDTDAQCVAMNTGAACVDTCCFECDQDSHCSGDQVCDPTTLQCVAPCETCCPNDAVCDGGDDCTDADCALCEADGTCVTGCTPADPDCVTVANITSEGGASASSTFSSDYSAGNALDRRAGTNWFSNGVSGGNSEVFTWVRTAPGDTSITRVETDAETFEGGGSFGFGQAQVAVFNDAGDEVFNSGFMALAAFRVDLEVALPAGIEGRSVQILLVDHQEPSCGGFSEFRVYGLRSNE